jgi:hypothetical protein
MRVAGLSHMILINHGYFGFGNNTAAMFDSERRFTPAPLKLAVGCSYADSVCSIRSAGVAVTSINIYSKALKEITMLYTIAVVLVILWLIGLVSAYTLGGFIHILLVIAIVIVLLRVISGRKPL